MATNKVVENHENAATWNYFIKSNKVDGSYFENCKQAAQQNCNQCQLKLLA